MSHFDTPPQNEDSRRAPSRLAIVWLTLAISVAFVLVIRDFLIALFLAALFSGLAYPLHQRLRKQFRGRATLAAVATLMLLIVLGGVPLFLLLSLVAAQAADLSEQVIPWVEEQMDNPQRLLQRLPTWLPFRDALAEPDPELVAKVGELTSKVVGFLAKVLSDAVAGTASFVLELFVMVYAMFWFLRAGPSLPETLMGYVPLPREIQTRLIDKGVSVTRATVKGTFVIGMVQGFLGGIAFAVVGIKGAALWGMLMAVASAIPGIGTVLIWGPAVVYLFLTGEYGAGTGLLVWSAGVVGTVDNVLRPLLVGKDTQMPDLLILISTLGGVSFFGAVGIVIGPIIAALFLTIWDVFAETFRPERSAADQGANAT